MEHQMSILTKQTTIGYGSRVTGKIQWPGLAARILGGRTASFSIWRFFCVHSMAKLSSLGGVVWEGATPAGSKDRSANPYSVALFAFGSAIGLKKYPLEVTP